MTNKTEDKFYFGKPGQPKRFANTYSGGVKYFDNYARVAAWDNGYAIVFRTESEAKSFILQHHLSVRGAHPMLLNKNWYVRVPENKPNFSRPGQPERFDASSLDRGNFAEASKSPILGKLLSEKAMPEGGWRAVQAGSDTLVISFEDGDVAGNFARRVAGKGYSATSPVQAIGRYWNVEVKNG